jgi:hypothetical protein
MPSLLFKLHNVPDDEAQDIRSLLKDNDIRFYETDAGFWRVGLDAIWLPDDSQAEQARTLIDSYQIERNTQQRLHYAELVEQGGAPGIWAKIVAQPLRFLGIVVAIFFILGLTLIPFVMLMF